MAGTHKSNSITGSYTTSRDGGTSSISSKTTSQGQKEMPRVSNRYHLDQESCSKKTLPFLPSDDNSWALTNPIPRRPLPKARVEATTGLEAEAKIPPIVAEHTVETQKGKKVKNRQPPPNIFVHATGSTIRHTTTSANYAPGLGAPPAAPYQRTTSHSSGIQSGVYSRTTVHEPVDTSQGTAPAHGGEANRPPPDNGNQYEAPYIAPQYNQYANNHFGAYGTSVMYNGLPSQPVYGGQYQQPALPYGPPTYYPGAAAPSREGVPANGVPHTHAAPTYGAYAFAPRSTDYDGSNRLFPTPPAMVPHVPPSTYPPTPYSHVPGEYFSPPYPVLGTASDPIILQGSPENSPLEMDLNGTRGGEGTSSIDAHRNAINKRLKTRKIQKR